MGIGERGRTVSEYTPVARHTDVVARMPNERRVRDVALARTDAVDLARYARTRNALDGHVSWLGPYLTHGVTDVSEVLSRLSTRGPLDWSDKFINELGWREYAQHVWRKLGDNLWREPVPPPAAGDATYAREMPHDVVTASTGVAIIDEQIRALYATGLLHNHARMWIASYVVHLRKVEWRVGASWMYAHLLDGDLAANTLGWQWVAGTWTGKPYLFNAENVAKYAPGREHRGTSIDATYDALDAMARRAQAYAEPPHVGRARSPAEAAVPPSFDADIVPALARELGLRVIHELPVDFAGELLHPWSMHARNGGPITGLIVPSFHQTYRWSERRWRFVLQAMAECGGESTCNVFIGTDVPLHSCTRVTLMRTPHAGYRDFASAFADRGGEVTAPPRAFADPDVLQKSFSAYWNRVTRAPFPG